ncbi:MAG: NTP transferase domain-containing protein [Myxococcota bacterium]
MAIPAIVAAGDLRASKAIYGESKAYLEIEGRPLVRMAVAALQGVPEVSEVWVVGNAERLQGALGGSFEQELTKPLHIVGQFRNLFENGWETYRRLLPGAPPEGRDPREDELAQPVLFLSCDIPFATEQEISVFVRRALDTGADYVMGLCTEESMEAFYPEAPGEPGIRMAYFNLREGRMRQSNLHLIRPGRIVNRHYIEEMYELRYQREFGNMVALAWRLLRSERGGGIITGTYLLMQLASIADRSGWKRIADRVRRWIPIPRIEWGVSLLLRSSFRLVVTEGGGCGVDIDNEHDLAVARGRFAKWDAAQRERVEKLYGPLPLPAPRDPS